MRLFMVLFLLCPVILNSEQVLNIAISYCIYGPYGDSSCSCKGLGGMAQLANIIYEIKKRNNSLLVVDLGNFLSGKPNTDDLDMSALKMMEYMEYDAMNIGENEIKDAPSWIDRFSPHLKTPMLSINIASLSKNYPLYLPWTIVKKGDLRIGIVGMSDASRFNSEFLKLHDLKMGIMDLQMKSVLDLLKDKTDIMILLYYGYFSEAIDIAKKFPQFKIILVGGKDKNHNSRIVYPMKSMVLELPYTQQLCLLNVFIDKGAVQSFIPQIYYLGHIAPDNTADQIIRYYSKPPERNPSLENSRLVEKEDWKPGQICMEVFYSENCPHCRSFLKNILPAIKQGNQLNISYYNIDKKEDYLILLQREKRFNHKTGDMPAVVLPSAIISGPDECNLKNLSDAIGKANMAKEGILPEWLSIFRSY
ncbi:MAG: hypothetical protein JXA60_09015 [Candidatus Coatesbacteria bacterium]|nr:hypothetical protein [Candidatus Coatesbacteria bacterium]